MEAAEWQVMAQAAWEAMAQAAWEAMAQAAWEATVPAAWGLITQADIGPARVPAEWELTTRTEDITPANITRAVWELTILVVRGAMTMAVGETTTTTVDMNHIGGNTIITTIGMVTRGHTV